MNNLTPREFQIAQLAAGACTNKEIAVLLDCSEQTVKNHLHKAFEKLGAKNRVQLTLDSPGKGSSMNTRQQLLSIFVATRQQIEQRIATSGDPRNRELIDFISRCDDELVQQALQEIADAAAKEIAELWWINPLRITPQKQAAIAKIVLKHLMMETTKHCCKCSAAIAVPQGEGDERCHRCSDDAVEEIAEEVTCEP